MLAEAERQTPELVRRSYEATYREMRNAGFTAVGEFHYLGLPEAFAAVEAAAAAGIEIVLLHVAYARGGLPGSARSPSRRTSARSRSSVRRRYAWRSPPTPCARAPPSGSPRSGAMREGRAAASPRARGRAAEGDRGMPRRAWLSSDRAARPHRLPRQADDGSPRDARRRDGARSPGLDGRDHLRMSHDRGRPRRRLPSGRADPRSRDPALHRERFERAYRSVRGAARARGHRRRQTGRRGIFTTEELYRFGSELGADALGLESWPGVEIDLEHPALAGTERDDIPAALIAGCSSDVLRDDRALARRSS